MVICRSAAGVPLSARASLEEKEREACGLCNRNHPSTSRAQFQSPIRATPSRSTSSLCALVTVPADGPPRDPPHPEVVVDANAPLTGGTQ